jgi:hypothetical protein
MAGKVETKEMKFENLVLHLHQAVVRSEMSMQDARTAFHDAMMTTTPEEERRTWLAAQRPFMQRLTQVSDALVQEFSACL